MAKNAHMIIHFMDSTKIVVQTSDGVIVMPVSNVKHIQVTSPPEALPERILKNAEIAE